jgi:hypothetical protein
MQVRRHGRLPLTSPMEPAYRTQHPKQTERERVPSCQDGCLPPETVPALVEREGLKERAVVEDTAQSPGATLGSLCRCLSRKGSEADDVPVQRVAAGEQAPEMEAPGSGSFAMFPLASRDQARRGHHLAQKVWYKGQVLWRVSNCSITCRGHVRQRTSVQQRICFRWGRPGVCLGTLSTTSNWKAGRRRALTGC